MKETPVVGELGVQVVTGTATGAQFVVCQFLEAGGVFRIEHLVDAAAMLFQGIAFRSVQSEGTSLSTLLAGGSQCWVGVDRTAMSRMKLEMEVVGTAVGVSGVPDVADDGSPRHIGAGG